MPSTSIRLQFDRRSIQTLRQYLADIQSPRGYQSVKKRFESHENQKQLLSRGRQIVEQHVYSAYAPKRYQRTRNLYKSVVVEIDVAKTAMGSMALFSDPQLAEAKLIPGYSYAAFFIEPEEFSTFIPPRGIAKAPINYRPFFQLWERFAERFIPQRACEAVVEGFDDIMPLELRRKR
jgi:hypothetical protein